MDREQLKAYLPHREPMLLVDEADLMPDGTALGRYTVRGDEWFLQGHYPGNPIVPGVVLCEMLAQTASVLFLEELKGATPLYMGMDKVRFHEPVRPGQAVTLRVSLVRNKANYYFTKGEALVGNKSCANGEFAFALVKKA